MRQATAAPMPPDQFWEIIEHSGGATADSTQESKLRAALSALSLDDIIAFEVAYRRYLNEAYTWELWGAAYIANGGCSDDGFEYFRRWLVARGRKAYETGVTNPDALAELDLSVGPDDMWEDEGIYYAARDVFEEKGGSGDARDYSDGEAGMGGPGPSGQKWEEDDLQIRYPKLWAKFGEEPLG